MKKDRRASSESSGARRAGKGGGNSRKVTYGLLALAVVLLLGSTIGSTRAALTYYSENYTAEITVSQIGVSLVENGKVVSSRDYEKNEWKMANNAGEGAANGTLLKGMLKDGEKLALNKSYEEKLSVRNSGTIDEYVRMRNWNQNSRSPGGEQKELRTRVLSGRKSF